MFPGRILLPTVALLLSTGCGYIHFGRWPGPAAARSGDRENDLALENKMLKQELALARQEGDSLRAALERSGAATGPAALAGQLDEATRELAVLRAATAKDLAGATRSENEQELAAMTREQARLQDENQRLRGDLDRARTENAGLGEKLKAVTAQNDQAQAAVSELNQELLAQKEARDRAERDALGARAQLGAIIAAGSAPAAATTEGKLPRVNALQEAKSPPAGASLTAEFHVSPEQLKATPAPRTHVVAQGETLETIALKYYGDSGQWKRIADANPMLAEGQPLAAGTALEIPPP